MSYRPVRLAAALAGACLGLACASLKAPTLQVESLKVGKLGVTGAGLDVGFRVQNPNPEALEIDKQLAVPGKIFRDLVLLGRAAKARGHGDDAALLLGRALAVARASQDASAIAEVQGLLAEAR